MSYQYYLHDLAGTLYVEDTPLVKFEVKDRKLVYAEYISKERLPHDIYHYGLTYHAFNEFFRHRVVLDGSEDIREYLDAMGLVHYDFNELVIKMNGWNALDLYWVKFDDLGASSWKEIRSQRYPIC